jgi:hypoxanthine phosphoribosyltransferase
METKLTPLISEETIATTVKRLARQLDKDYDHHSLMLVGILKGSFIFLADLVRNMKTPINNIEFMRLSSYGSKTSSSGKVEVVMRVSEEVIKNQHVLLVEDIIDTGITTTAALVNLRSYNPASLKLCALLDKPARRQVPMTIDYLGLTVPNRFIVGYGIDFDQKYRQLPAIYMLDE